MRLGLKAIGLAGMLALALASSAQGADEFDQYRIESASTSISDNRAGAHPDFTLDFGLATKPDGSPYAQTRDVEVTLPPGLFGNPQALPKCTIDQFGDDYETSSCPQDSQVGITEVRLGGTINFTFSDPIYNMPAPGGDSLARFGFYAGLYPTFINVRYHADTGRLVAVIEGASSAASLVGATTTFWGVPAAPSHDTERLTPKEAGYGESPVNGRPSGQPEVPFMTNPTSCESTQLTLVTRSYPLPGSPSSATVPFPQIVGCGAVEFKPSVSLEPTTTQATTGTGLSFQASLPQKGLEFPNLTYGSELKRVEVKLPEGMTINPSEAEGLGVCSEADLAREAYDSAPNVGCPETSKIGSVVAESPAIDRRPEGSLYLAKPYENPFGSLLALYLVVKIPDRGLMVKLAGEVQPDPRTGQLVTTFDNIPQLPVAAFKLKFREGERAPLVTPPACGNYATTFALSPWSSPASPLAKSSSFAIESGPGRGPCPSGGRPPFHPDLVAGTRNNAAGSFSPFDVRISRTDSEQEITHFSIKLPPGVAAKLAGVPLCGDLAIALAASRTGPHGGREELDNPSCPAASEVGHTLVGVGVGSALTYVPGKIYLAGPYHGAPISFVSVTSGVAGPFDVGTVVVRLAIKVNPETGEVFLDSTGSDPIPHIIKGIPVHLRDIRAYTDRPQFTFNPTSCEPTSTAATVLGSGLDFASESDDNPFVSTSPFQAADCAALPFHPKLRLTLKGSHRRAGNPALKAHVTMGGFGEAGLGYARVELPRTLFLDNAHIGTICTRVQFKEGAVEGEKCPKGSIIGHARAVTPILSKPLEGLVYLRSNPERELPDVAAALQGSEIHIVAVGHIDSGGRGGLRNTFEVIPDAPVSSVDLNLFGGKRGLIESSRNLCSYRPTAAVSFKGHNGKAREFKLKMKTPGCGKHRRQRSRAGRHRGH